MTLRQQIGREIESMWKASGLPLTDVRIVQIVGSTRTFKRLMAGTRVRLTFPVIGALCDLFEATDQKKFELQRLWDLVDRDTWMQSMEAMLRSGFSPYLGFEQIATAIDLHETTFVTGLFQTERYVRQMHKRDPFVRAEQLDELTGVRLERQRRMKEREAEVLIRALLHEGVLRSGCDAEQLELLCEVDSRPNIQVAYVPFAIGPVPSLSASFSVLSLSKDRTPDLVYFEAPGESRFVEEAVSVQRCKRAFEEGLRQARTVREFKP
ncbi:DUF5753 domain-containing protein [Glycomyces sp. NRRL B-16210]|uniref:DUF5753 domain-containing protein n=1 Tax=Glycomyces sp. NRRL B-16210 TaxID=1463821 RepID=UPI0004BEA148|nr:DUF5753 domain-containing protein [Glycomyces sp. NRRL B-16210]